MPRVDDVASDKEGDPPGSPGQPSEPIEIFRSPTHFAALWIAGISAIVCVAIGLEDGLWDSALLVYAIMLAVLGGILVVAERYGYRNCASRLAIDGDTLIFEHAGLFRRGREQRMPIRDIVWVRDTSEPIGGRARGNLYSVLFEMDGETYKIPVTGATFVDAKRMDAIFR